MSDVIHTCRPCGCGFADGMHVVICPEHEGSMAQRLVTALNKGRAAMANMPRTLGLPPEAFDGLSLNGDAK